MPTSQNVELILRDYNPAPPAAPSGRSSKKDKNPPSSQVVEKPKYAAAHLHFVDGAYSVSVRSNPGARS